MIFGELVDIQEAIGSGGCHKLVQRVDCAALGAARVVSRFAKDSFFSLSVENLDVLFVRETKYPLTAVKSDFVNLRLKFNGHEGLFLFKSIFAELVLLSVETE